MSKVYEHKRCPVAYTCPHIDDTVSLVEEAVLDGLHEDTAYLIRQHLEELREENATLRQWGCEEAAKVDMLEAHLKCTEELIDAAIGGL